MSTTLPVPAAPGADGGAGATGDPSLDARWYSAAVRSELADLPADVVEELTGGLEADLAELAAESSTPLAERLGAPRGYADELRSAAGLAPRSAAAAGAGSGLWARATEGVREDVDHALTHLRGQRWWPGAVERAALLRPAWWVLRGVLAAWLLHGFFSGPGLEPGGVVLALVAVAVSVELGRRRPSGRWSRPLVVAGNVLALLVAPVALLGLTTPTQSVYTEYTGSGPATSTGVWVDGRQVTNLYPYDAQGQPLTGVQLLDDSGQPVSTTTGDAEDWAASIEGSPVAPVVDAEGAVHWNAYPLAVHSDAGGPAVVPPLPQPTLAPLLVAGAPAATPTSGATPTGLPSTDPTAGVLVPAPETTSTEVAPGADASTAPVTSQVVPS